MLDRHGQMECGIRFIDSVAICFTLLAASAGTAVTIYVAVPGSHEVRRYDDSVLVDSYAVDTPTDVVVGPD